VAHGAFSNLTVTCNQVVTQTCVEAASKVTEIPA
jgi:hypothetical protein